MNTEHANMVDLIDAPDFAVETGSGRATWDERGNSIWEWQTAPGVYSRDISSQQLQELEAPSLRLLDGAQVSVDTLWSRNAQGKLSARVMHTTELVMPMRSNRSNKGGSFDHFLRRLGLPV